MTSTTYYPKGEMESLATKGLGTGLFECQFRGCPCGFLCTGQPFPFGDSEHCDIGQSPCEAVLLGQHSRNEADVVRLGLVLRCLGRV